MPTINTADYWGNNDLADVTICIGHNEIKCHKFVLVQGSMYFRALLLVSHYSLLSPMQSLTCD